MFAIFDIVYGVDFSGARWAGRNTWVARIERSHEGPAPFRLTQLVSLEAWAGDADRAPALNHLVRQILESSGALWALDFPFGLPIEVMEAGGTWPDQFDFLRRFGDDAYAAGLECLRRARERGGPGHIRRRTDRENRAPFDSYHYRIIYQTFHGMRDVLLPLCGDPDTAILPFHHARLATARRALAEACPASTLQRLGLPHQNYKQTGAGPLEARHLRPRWDILDGLAPHVTIGRAARRTMMENCGGDALDAVIAAVGASRCLATLHTLSPDPDGRYLREGRQYV